MSIKAGYAVKAYAWSRYAWISLNKVRLAAINSCFGLVRSDQYGSAILPPSLGEGWSSPLRIHVSRLIRAGRVFCKGWRMVPLHLTDLGSRKLSKSRKLSRKLSKSRQPLRSLEFSFIVHAFYFGLEVSHFGLALGFSNKVLGVQDCAIRSP